MWIKAADHAFNGELKKLLVGDLVNVVVLHGVKDARELTHFHQREFGFSLLVGIDLHAGSGKSAGQSTGDEKRKKTELHWYMFNKNGRGEIPGVPQKFLYFRLFGEPRLWVDGFALVTYLKIESGFIARTRCANGGNGFACGDLVTDIL